MKVIYPTYRAVKDTVDTENDNVAIKTMIRDFREFLVDLKPLDTLPDGSKLDTVNYQSFEYSEAMLHQYCELTNTQYWGQTLAMMELANATGNGPSEVYDINLIVKCNPIMLDAAVPAFLPNSTQTIDEVTTQKTWRNWRGENTHIEKNGGTYLLTITDRKLNMGEILQLKQYKDEYPEYEIKFFSHHEYLAL